ncbi:MAG: hypothetical protein AAF696_36600 [Bacteroidota bacterium]
MGLWKSAKAYFKKQRDIYRSVSEQDIIAMTLQNGNKITSASLAAHTALNNMQASRKLQTMQTKGILAQKYNYKNGYSSHYKVKHPELFQDLPKNPVSIKPKQEEQKLLTDAEVISAAVESKGRLIPGVLCINADISIDQAKEKLQELQHKGVFDIEVTPEGAMVYLLNDYAVYRNLMSKEEKALDE